MLSSWDAAGLPSPHPSAVLRSRVSQAVFSIPLSSDARSALFLRRCREEIWKMVSSNNPGWFSRGLEAPELCALREDDPGGDVVGIEVPPSARALGPDEEPVVRRAQPLRVAPQRTRRLDRVRDLGRRRALEEIQRASLVLFSFSFELASSRDG